VAGGIPPTEATWTILRTSRGELGEFENLDHELVRRGGDAYAGRVRLRPE
jgi:hypothetical protein